MTKSALTCTSGSTYRVCTGYAIYKDRWCLYLFACEQVKPPYVIKPNLNGTIQFLAYMHFALPKGKDTSWHSLPYLYYILVSSFDIFIPHIFIYCQALPPERLASP